MKIYIASRTSERNIVKKLSKLFVSEGHQILDWTWHKNIKPYNKNKKVAKDYAIEDIENIKNCDIFILLANKNPGTGSTTELGAAIASNLINKSPKIYVVGKSIDKNLFYFYPSVIIKKNIDEVLKEI